MTTETQPQQKVLSIDEAVEHIISQHPDHLAFLREQVRDNIIVGRTAEKLYKEYNQICAEMETAILARDGSIAFAIRRTLNQSRQRLAAYFKAQAPTPEVKS